MSPRVVVHLSRVAQLALLLAIVGAALAVYGRLQDVELATQAGTFLLFGGAILYVIERMRSSRQKYEKTDD
jgi:hypothetical protein